MELKAKRKKGLIILAIVCFVLAAALLLIAFWVTTLFKSPFNEVNTMKLRGTFERVEKDKNDYYIYVDEYECKLMLVSAVIVDADYLLQLKKGESIYFRINDSAQNLLNDSSVTQLAIITLKTDQEDIATFESYKKLKKKQITNAKITGIFFAIVFILGGVYCILRLNGVALFRKDTSSETRIIK